MGRWDPAAGGGHPAAGRMMDILYIVQDIAMISYYTQGLVFKIFFCSCYVMESSVDREVDGKARKESGGSGSTSDQS